MDKPGNAGSLGRGGHDICLGGNGGGFRKSDGTAEMMLVVVVVIETAPPEHSGEVGTSEDHLKNEKLQIYLQFS